MLENSQTPTEIPYKAELMRKSLHLLALVIPVGMFFLGKTNSLLILVPLCLLALFLEVARVKSSKIAALVDIVFGSMMRPQERPSIGSPVVINGATWVLLAATLLVFIFPVNIAAASMITFMLADAAAALIGRRFGRIKWGKLDKTVEGSFAFFVVAFVSILFFDPLNWIEAVIIAACSALLELVPLSLNDNLYVPLFTATLISILLIFFHQQEILFF